MNKKRIVVGLFSLVLSVLAATNIYGFYQARGSVDVLYAAFTVIGLTGAIAVLLNRRAGRWMLIFFYAIQLVFVYGESFHFVLNPGISLPIKFLTGKIGIGIANISGIGINILAIIMLFLCYRWLRDETHNQSKQEEASKSGAST